MDDQSQLGGSSVISDQPELAHLIVKVDAERLSSAVLKRLVEDVRNEASSTDSTLEAYDRVHNRHNR